jgi:hypothetical protein
MNDRRRKQRVSPHRRVKLQTQVAVSQFDVVHELSVAKASPNGLFLEGNPRDLPEFSVGVEVNLRLFDEQLDEKEDVVATARVVRIVRGKGVVASGVALEFIELDEPDRVRLQNLLARQGAISARA